MNRTERDRFVLALKTSAEDGLGLHRCTVRVLGDQGIPDGYMVTGYKKDGKYFACSYRPEDPEKPTLPTTWDPPESETAKETDA